MIRVALLGAGAWGRNLLRVLAAMRAVRLVAIVEPLSDRRERARALAPDARAVATFDALDADDLDAVVIATPPATHAALALAAIDAGLDVFVEKPLAVRVGDADRCAARAEALGRVAMVGHLLRYHPSLARLVSLARAGALGDIVHFGAVRFSIGGDRATPTLWALGPHDLSVLRDLRGGSLEGLDVSATREDGRVVLDARPLGGASARIELSRAHPSKVRTMRIVGSDATASFDDVAAPDRFTITSRSGERVILADWAEPLAVEMNHFIDCVAKRARPLTGFDEGASVVRVLAHAAAHLARGSAENPERATRVLK